MHTTNATVNSHFISLFTSRRPLLLLSITMHKRTPGEAVDTASSIRSFITTTCSVQQSDSFVFSLLPFPPLSSHPLFSFLFPLSFPFFIISSSISSFLCSSSFFHLSFHLIFVLPSYPPPLLPSLSLSTSSSLPSSRLLLTALPPVLYTNWSRYR